MAQLTDTLVSGDERVTGMIYGTQAGNYATCTEAGATKTANIPGFVLIVGVHVRIKFSASNTAATPTLNVSGTGAKSIKVKGNNLAAAGDLAANGIYEFVYDGTNWELTGAVCGKATTANYGYVQLATGDMNGAANVDGVAVSKNHTHSQYLPKAGGTMTGGITLPTNFYHQDSKFGIDAKNSDIINVNSIYFNDESTSTDEGIHFRRGDSGNTDNYDSFWIDNGKICFYPNHSVSANTLSSSAQIVPRLPSSVSDNQVVLTNGTTGALKTLAASSLSVGTAATATSANITRTADTTNGDKLQIGSGTAVNVVNSQSTLNVAAGSATTNTNARHIWFSDSSTETKRAYSGDLTYRTDYNRITAHVSGYSTGLNQSNNIQHQEGGDASTFQYKVHRIATFPRSGITTQGGSADESLVLQLFTKGYNKEDYGIVLITVKLAGTVSNNPTVNVRWKLRSAAMPTDAVQAAFIKDGNGLWHVDVFFIIQHSYQLTVFNKLGSFSPADTYPQGGWTLISS